MWLDADEEGVKAAEGVGMKAILVENLDDALKKLAHFTGVQVWTVPTFLLYRKDTTRLGMDKDTSGWITARQAKACPFRGLFEHLCLFVERLLKVSIT